MNDPNRVMKWLLVIGMVVLSLLVLYPPSEKLKGGIDLVGGTSLLLEIDTTGLDADLQKGLSTRVMRILKEHGIEPAPERRKHMPWSKFLKAHWQAIAAADFFTIEVWTKIGLVRHLVFFVLDLATRRVEIAGIAPIPDGLWMEQRARNLVDGFAGFLRGMTHLIHDRDPLFTAKFREILKSGGVESVRLPPKSPNLNAYAERFVLSIKSECLGRMVLVGERHLRRAIDEYMEHYHLERTHQGLGNTLIDGVPESAVGEVARRERLGGLLNSYYREAA